MLLPTYIPQGARIVVRVSLGIDAHDHRVKYRDYVGHVQSWDGSTLCMIRDASANASRPEEYVELDASTIVILKPVPERPNFKLHNGIQQAHDSVQ